MNKFISLSVFLFLLIPLHFSFAVLPNFSANPAMIPFGGRIITTHVCPCSFSLLFIVQNLPENIPTPLMFTPFVSKIRLFGMFIPGNYVLGTYVPKPIPCLTGVMCIPDPKIPTALGTVSSFPFSGAGTSLIPIK